MIHIYSGDKQYLLHNYLHVYKCTYDTALLSASEMIEYIDPILKQMRKKPHGLRYWVSNNPDFISTMYYACEILGLHIKLYVNGKQSTLEEVFAFLNQSIDLSKKYLEKLKEEVK